MIQSFGEAIDAIGSYCSRCNGLRRCHKCEVGEVLYFIELMNSIKQIENGQGVVRCLIEEE
jgi:hypothetical protein